MSMSSHARRRTPVIDVHLEPDDLRAALRADVDRGLTRAPDAPAEVVLRRPRQSSCSTRSPACPSTTRPEREREILEAQAATIADAPDADTLVELGSGTSEKTRLAARRVPRRGHAAALRAVRRVASGTLRWSAAAIGRASIPGIEVHAVVGDFDHHLEQLPAGGRRLVVFLGGTIGNYEPRRSSASCWPGSPASSHPGDSLLLGTDLVKDPARLVAAYDDAAGVTAEFNRNVLAGAQPRARRRLRAGRASTTSRCGTRTPNGSRCACGPTATRPCGSTRWISTCASPHGEEMRTEVSAKFRRARRRGRAARPPAWSSPTGGPTPPATSRSACRFGPEPAGRGHGPTWFSL